MLRNVGPTERYARLAIGAAAAIGAARAHGWQRTLLSSIAGAGLTTGFTRYCPVNQALGVNRANGNTGDVDRDTEIRRQTAINSALGLPPSAGSDEPEVTPEGDLFGQSRA